MINSYKWRCESIPMERSSRRAMAEALEFACVHSFFGRWQPVCKVAPNDYLSVKGER
jgi:hypothetical protein